MKKTGSFSDRIRRTEPQYKLVAGASISTWDELMDVLAIVGKVVLTQTDGTSKVLSGGFLLSMQARLVDSYLRRNMLARCAIAKGAGQ